MLYVYVTSECEKEAAAIGMSGEVEKLRQKLIEAQATAGLRRHPQPFLKKVFGRTRLIMAELLDGEDVVLCFLRHVYKHVIGDDYQTFFDAITVPTVTDPSIAEFLAKARTEPVETKPELSELELEYLHVIRAANATSMVILESPLWTKSIADIKHTPGKQGLLTPIWEALLLICEQDATDRSATTERYHERHGVRVLYRYYPENNKLFLVAPLETSAIVQAATVTAAAQALLNDSVKYDEHQLLRNSARAYPDFVVWDREIWETMQASIEANLALSPEESDVLDHALDPAKEGGFPLFINGRPGSGKSTILQYLFSEFLHAHLARPKDNRLDVPPLYLTYNERLLQNAKSMLEAIFKCGAEKIASEQVDIGDKDQRKEFDNAFAYFREFLLSLVPVKGRFEPRKYVDFHRFKTMYSSELQRGDARLRKSLPSEVAWHTLRTYIKGKSDTGNDGVGEYFDPSSYAELPRDEVTISAETYELVWDKVWNGWYRGLCEQDGLWDDQDLARYILDKDLADAIYPAIFCDESQDFTTIELELIFRLSLYSARRVDPHYLPRIPFAFAGDPFQTLNPTGFRWDAIKANFHSNIVQQLDPARRSKVDFTFKELAFNYRSTSNIVHFCNLIQLKRGELFEIQDIKPQKAWAVEEGGWPSYFRIDDLSCQAKLKEQSELVIVVPCQEGEEKSFIQKDNFLNGFALSAKGEITRNVLSPMRAKGLEFARVVLYKFGEEAKSQKLTEVMAGLDRGVDAKREQTLGLEYFFNSVYVGASRAQRRLFVIDTEEGLGQFWKFATDSTEIGKLLTPRRRQDWESIDLHHMVRGTGESWQADRDDPRALADRFFQQGKMEKSTHLLQLAKSQYDSIGDVAKQEFCAALIADIDGNFAEAATSYYKVGEYREAIRCYWESGNFQKVSDIAKEDVGSFSTSPYVLAALYQTGEESAENAADFLKKLGQVPLFGTNSLFSEARWADVFGNAVDVLGRSLRDDLLTPTIYVGDVSRVIDRFRSDQGLELKDSKELAKLAFHAGDHNRTLEIWENLEKRAIRNEPKFVIRAKATTSSYPDNLRWYASLSDSKAILEEYRQKGDSQLDEHARVVVLKAMLDLSEFAQGADFVIRSGQAQLIRRYLQSLSVSDSDAQFAVRVLQGYMQACTDTSDFRQLVDELTKPEETGVPAFETVLAMDSMRFRVVAGLFKLLARSVRFVDDKANNKYVAGILERLIQKDPEKFLTFVSVEEIGSAFERAGKTECAVKFYESVYQEHKWGRQVSLDDFAKQRILKCQERVASENPKQKDKLLRQVKEQSSKWGLGIPKDEYPVLKPLSRDVLDEILTPDGITSSHESAITQDKDLLQYAEEVVESHDISVEASQSATFQAAMPSTQSPAGINILQKPPFDGKIEFELHLGELVLKVLILPTKRRIEFRNAENDDLMQVHGKTHEIESRDVICEPNPDLLWNVLDWGIAVSILLINEHICLVDVCTSDDRRVICISL